MRRIQKIIMCAVCVALLWGCSQPRESRHPLFKKAQRAERRGDFETAISYYKRYLKVRPDSTRAHLVMAAIYDENLSEPAAAIYHYQRFLELEPQSSRAANARKMLSGVKRRYYLKMKDQYNDAETLEALKTDLVGLQHKLKQSLAEAKRLRSFLDIYKRQMLKLSRARKAAELEQAKLNKSGIALNAKITALEAELKSERAKKEEVKAPTLEKKAPEAPGKKPKTPEKPETAQTLEVPAKAAEPEKKEPAAKRARVYTVKEGDTLSSIARRFYNDSKMYRKIMQFNKELLPAPESLKAGMQLLIPDLSPAVPAGAENAEPKKP